MIEEIAPSRLASLAEEFPDVSEHWQASLDQLRLILLDWPALLKERGRIDLAERRNLLLNGVARRWRERPPPGFVCAAGITTAAPAAARLLGTVARLERGLVVFPALDTELPAEEWAALGPHEPDESGRRPRAVETHPQFNLKLLLDRMSVGRGEVERWPLGRRGDAPRRGAGDRQCYGPGEFTKRAALRRRTAA